MLMFVQSYLENRRVIINYPGATIEGTTTKECIQEFTCGSLLWNVQLDTLLKQADDLGVHLQAFAVDQLLVARDKTTQDTERKLNPALEVVKDWGSRFKMMFSAQKAQAIICTRKLRYAIPELYFGEIRLTFGEDVKVLGLTIDRGLSFSNHLHETNKRVASLYKSVSRTARAQWA